MDEGSFVAMESCMNHIDMCHISHHLDGTFTNSVLVHDTNAAKHEHMIQPLAVSSELLCDEYPNILVIFFDGDSNFVASCSTCILP